MKSKTRRVPQTVKDQVDAEINRCINVAEQAYGRTFKFPTVKYDLRGTTAGWAQDTTNTININSVLLMENLDTFIDGRTGRGTVTHEFAHLVDGIVNPQTRNRGWGRKRSVHGPTWKRIMMLFGATPSRCHKYDTTNSKVRTKAKHIYTCNSCGKRMTIGPVRHRKQQAGPPAYSNSKTVYSMRGCSHAKRTGYTYIGQEGQSAPKPNVAAQTNPTPKTKTVKPGTKLAHAVQILRDNPLSQRVRLIEMIRIACNMSQAGAQTYYYNAKKAL